MANKQGYWKLMITDYDVELDDADRNHIAELICQEYTEGVIEKTETDDGDIIYCPNCEEEVQDDNTNLLICDECGTMFYKK
jgi:hypothetical protein